MKPPRIAVLAAVGAVAAAVVVLGVTVRAVEPTVYSESTVRLIGQVEKGTAIPLSELRGLGPVVAVPARWLESALGAQSALWILSYVGLVLLTGLVFVFARYLLGLWGALVVSLLFLLCPQTLQLLFEPGGAGLAVFFLLSPSLVFGLAAGHSGPGSTLLAVAGGALAGASVLAHPMGLWTALAALLGLAVARKPEPGSAPAGMVRPSALGLELGGALAAFILVAGAGALAIGAGKNELVAWLFGSLTPFHPPLSVAGTVYSEAVDGGPPLWTTAWLLLARTPVLLVAAALSGAVLVSLKRLKRRPNAAGCPAAGLGGIHWLSGPLAPATLTWLAVVLFSSLSGSPLLLPGLSLLVPASLLPCLLAAACVSCLLPLPSGSASQSVSQSASASSSLLSRLPAPALGLLLLASVAWSGWHLRPYPAAFGSLLCGGTDRCNLANEPWIEPVMDSSLVDAVSEPAREIIVAPWGTRAQLVWAWTGALPKGAKVKDGGPWPALVWHPAPRPATLLLLDACNPDDRMASLPPGTRRLWSFCR